MNERVKQLALQAGFNLPNNLVEGVNGPGVVTEKDKLEKFAELIVRECIKKCQDHPSIIFKNEWDADVVAPDIVNRLESHFGVEL